MADGVEGATVDVAGQALLHLLRDPLVEGEAEDRADREGLSDQTRVVVLAAPARALISRFSLVSRAASMMASCSEWGSSAGLL
jgi:hypothetical protein